MSKSLIRKNQLHPDIADLISGYGDNFFTTPQELELAIDTSQQIITQGAVLLSGNQNVSGLKNFTTRPTVNGSGVLLSGEVIGVVTDLSTTVRTTGNQTVSGVKAFISRPTVNGTGVLLSGEAVQIDLSTTVRTTGNQTISGVKSFTSLPNVNGIPLSTGIGAGGEFTFNSSLPVKLAPGKTFGKYRDGDTIQAAGLTTSQVIRMAISEAISPTVNLTSAGGSIPFNQTGVSVVLNFNYVINSASPATVSSVSLESKRADGNTWTVLSTGIGIETFTHTTTNALRNTQAFNYRYIVTDSEGASTTRTHDKLVTPYVAPTVSNIVIGSNPALLGSVATTLAGEIRKNTPLTILSSYTLQYLSTAGIWTNVLSAQAIAGDPSSQSFSINQVRNFTLVNRSSIEYRIRVVDSDANGVIETTNISLGTRNFLYGNYFGYSSATSLSTVAQIEALGNEFLSNGKSRPPIVATTPNNQSYTYYAYNTVAGDLTSIVQDGATTIFINGEGAFQKQGVITGTNINGAGVSYTVYRSVDRGAFSSNTLVFN
jgi:hypothetical protein